MLCRVALGKSFLQFNAMKMAHAPPGHHSVVGRPSVGGLSFPEYVVYRGEQVRQWHYTGVGQLITSSLLLQAYPEYLVTYLIVKPEARTEEELTIE